MVWKKAGCYSVGMTTFRQKKSTASVEDGEQEVAAFWKKIWGWGSYSDTKTEYEPIMLYCCKQAAYWGVGGG